MNKIFVEKNIFARSNQLKEDLLEIYFIHGFAESSLSFYEAFSSPLADKFNLIAVDLPGFGVSPSNKHSPTIEDSAKDLVEFIKQISKTKKIGLVCHSMGSLVGTYVVKMLGRQIIGMVSIEGNMTEMDCFFSGKAKGFSDEFKFYNYFKDEVLKLTSDQISIHRYYASIQFANPSTLLSWGISGVKETGNTQAAEEYAKLSCPKVYYWGKASAPKETIDYLINNQLENIEFESSGHWPQIDESSKCYRFIGDFFHKLLNSNQ